MGAFWRGLVRTIFWSYERMSWPYDLMVIAIVAFVLLTPRSWFHDRPVAGSADSPSIQLISQDPANQTRIYKLDPSVFPPEVRATQSTPQLERLSHDVLAQSVKDLQKREFQVRQVSPVLTGDGSVLYYDVIVQL
jgi:hypothetical protein